jgi:hypothetical protein
MRLRATVPLAVALAVAAAPARAAEPAPQQTSAAPPVPFAPGEQIDLAVDYGQIRTGQVRMTVGRPEGAVWPVICQAKTDGIASVLDIREHYVSYWDAESRLSRGSDLNAIEVGDRHTDRSRFDRANGKATVEVIRKGRSHESTHDIPPDAHDLASALLRLRMESLAPGTHLEFPVFSGKKTFTLRADVEAREEIDTPAGRFRAVRVRVELGFEDKFKTTRPAYLWVSDDERRIPLRGVADFAVGRITASLTGYRPGSQLATAR